MTPFWRHFDKSWNRTSFTPKYCVQRKRSGGVSQRVCVCVSWTRAPNPLKRVALLTGEILNSLWDQHSCRFVTQHSAANSWRIARCKRAPGQLCGSQLEIEISSTFYTAWILHQNHWSVKGLLTGQIRNSLWDQHSCRRQNLLVGRSINRKALWHPATFPANCNVTQLRRRELLKNTVGKGCPGNIAARNVLRKKNQNFADTKTDQPALQFFTMMKFEGG